MPKYKTIPINALKYKLLNLCLNSPRLSVVLQLSDYTIRGEGNPSVYLLLGRVWENFVVYNRGTAKNQKHTHLSYRSIIPHAQKVESHGQCPAESQHPSGENVRILRATNRCLSGNSI